MKSSHIQSVMVPPWGGQRQDDGSEFQWLHANELQPEWCLWAAAAGVPHPARAGLTHCCLQLPSILHIPVRLVKAQGPSTSLG